jgi:predicted RNase H-like nuclease
MRVKIIGVDCATNPAKVGLALGIWRGQAAAILEVKAGSHKEPLAQTIIDWMPDAIPALIAMDAPLGWPVSLGRLLVQHMAGDHIDVDANQLFRRRTDCVVREKLSRQPLDVGADRIARTAHAALQLLDELRARSGYAVPLAWESRVEGVAAIEVYPAATLTAYGIQASGYKKKNDVEARKRIIERLREYLEMPEDTAPMEANADVLDAGVCVLAAADFLQGKVVQPTDMARAKKEGWIWFWAGAGATQGARA